MRFAKLLSASSLIVAMTIVGGIGSSLLAAGPAGASGACSSPVVTGSKAVVTCSYDGTTGADGTAQSWTPPTGVTEAYFQLGGAQGGSSGVIAGGEGGATSGLVDVSASDTYTIVAGGVGGYAGATFGAGGYGGGGPGGPGTGFGDGGSGGGGATSVSLGTQTLLVAGGGGGAVNYYANTFANGGAGGGLSGTAGYTANTVTATPLETGGAPGTQAGGGVASVDATSGEAGQGGTGGSGVGDPGCFFSGGGGGGGGYNGGAGGASCFGGGGGAGYVADSPVVSGNTNAGVVLGNGGVTITYRVPGPTTFDNVYYVTSAGDTGATDCTSPTNTDCGIDDAIAAFNADSTPLDADAIAFSSTLNIFNVGTPTAINNTTPGVTLAIQGNGVDATAVSGGGTNEVFAIDDGSTVTISELNIESGNVGSTGQGSGVNNAGTLSLTNDVVYENTDAQFGGGIYNTGSLDVTNTTFTANGALGGGAIDNNEGSLVVADSTFTQNAAINGGAIDNFGSASVTDSTITLNSGEGKFGGGIFNANVISVVASTLSGNSAGAGDGGDIFNFAGATATLSGTIVAANGHVGGGCSGSITDGGYDIDDDGSCHFSGTSVSDSKTLDASLSALADNGGPTQTMALSAGPAVNVIPNSTAGLCPTTDQRGMASAPGGSCDLGAYQTDTSSASVTGVYLEGEGTSPTFVITGSGFGTEANLGAPESTGYTGVGNAGFDYPNFVLSDTSANVDVGNPGDDIGIIISSYTNTEITFTLGADFENSQGQSVDYSTYSFAPGDNYSLTLDGSTLTGTIAYYPTATITAPKSKSNYTVGTPVPTSFSCSDFPGGEGIATCLDSNNSTSPGSLNTTVPGHFIYSVTATSDEGFTTTAEISYSVSQTTPTIATTPTPSTATFGTATTLRDSATLLGGYQPTGMITFTLYKGLTQLYTETVTVSGNGTYTTSTGYPLPSTGTVAGTYQWDASYSGDTNNATVAENNSANEQVVVAPKSELTTTSLNIAKGTITYGNETVQTFNGVVTGQTGDGAPVGTVNVTTGATPLCSATLVAGTGDSSTYVCALTSPTEIGAANDTVTASFDPGSSSSNNANYTYSASASTSSNNHTFVIARDNTTTAITQGGPTTITPGTESSALFDVTVAAQHGEAVPNGEKVTVQVGTASCLATLTSGAGYCSIANNALAVGSYAVSASYPGDSNLLGSGATGARFVVSPVKVNTTTTVTESPTTVAVGNESTVQFKVTVTAANNASVPNGEKVTVDVGSTYCAVPLNSDKGSCTISNSALSTGKYSVTASYPGDSTFNSSTGASATQLSVTKATGGRG